MALGVLRSEGKTLKPIQGKAFGLKSASAYENSLEGVSKGKTRIPIRGKGFGLKSANKKGFRQALIEKDSLREIWNPYTVKFPQISAETLAVYR